MRNDIWILQQRLINETTNEIVYIITLMGIWENITDLPTILLRHRIVKFKRL